MTLHQLARISLLSTTRSFVLRHIAKRMTFLGLMRITLATITVAWLAACSSPKTQAARGQPLARKPAKEISKKATSRMYVRTTAYHHSEPGGRQTAVGGYLRPTHSAASDWSWLPAGTRFRIVETGEDYIIEDYGSALIGKFTIDLYKSTRRQMNSWGVRYVHIEILELGSYKTSLAILQPRQKWPHVRRMVEGLKKKVN
jgi:3D (Asp-Asp-Asp) domain-containing protein